MYIFAAHKLLIDNGNDLPTRTPNLEFSDENRLNSGLICVFKELKTISDLNNYLGYAFIIIDVTTGFQFLEDTYVLQVSNYYEESKSTEDVTVRINFESEKILAVYH